MMYGKISNTVFQLSSNVHVHRNCSTHLKLHVHITFLHAQSLEGDSKKEIEDFVKAHVIIVLNRQNT